MVKKRYSLKKLKTGEEERLSTSLYKLTDDKYTSLTINLHEVEIIKIGKKYTLQLGTDKKFTVKTITADSMVNGKRIRVELNLYLKDK